MAWINLTLNAAGPTADISFVGEGTIYCDGTFVGSTLQVKPRVDALIASGFIAGLNASTKSVTVPSGQYRLNLDTPAGATVNVYYNDATITARKV
jgi:hypothetical protein